MTIDFDISEYIFYFKVQPSKFNAKDTFIEHEAMILLDSQQEWVGVEIKKPIQQRFFWGRENEVFSKRDQEAIVDCEQGKVIGIEINLWLTNRDIKFNKLMKEAKLRLLSQNTDGSKK